MQNNKKKLLGSILTLILVLILSWGGFLRQDSDPAPASSAASAAEMTDSTEIESTETVSAEAGDSTEIESTETASTEVTDPTETDSTEGKASDTDSGEQGTSASSEEDPQAKEDPKGQEAEQDPAGSDTTLTVDEDGTYTTKDEVALYLYLYGHLPSNFITKKEAQNLGWNSAKGNLQKVAPGMSIGGDRFGNREGLLPDKKGRKYTECDINYAGGTRGAERIVFSNDGLIYYTGDHYEHFELLYGEE